MTKKSAKSSKKSVKTSKKSTVKASLKPTKTKTPKALAPKPTKPAQKPAPTTKAPSQSAKPAKAAFKSPFPRSVQNPFRAGSSYGVVFDCLHAHPDGISRGLLVIEVSKATGKDERHAGYDCDVLLSAKQNGEMHQSCRPGVFWVERTNDFLKLHLLAPATAPATTT